MILRSQFGALVLNKLDPTYLTTASDRAMVDWASFENTEAAYNPYATTWKLQYVDNFNSVGVQNYHSLEDGINATINTLTNGLYGPILDALKNQSDEAAICQAISNSPWGSKPTPTMFNDVPIYPLDAMIPVNPVAKPTGPEYAPPNPIAGTKTVDIIAGFPVPLGYILVDVNGTVFPQGRAQNYGDASKENNVHIVDAFASEDGRGYTLIGRNGEVYCFGSAVHYGNL